MIQIYLPENTAFDKNGDMVLTPTEATVSAALNGEWTLEMEHPIDSEGRWKYIRDQAVIKVPSFNGEQLFRILSKKKTDESVSVTAEPIFMDARNDCFLTDVRPTDKSGQEALDILTVTNKKYSGKSDIIRRSTAYYQDKNLIEALCGEDENSFLRRWGGEILFDNFTVAINERVGGDYGVNLLYGKNLVRGGLEEDVDFSDVCTRIYPKAYNGYPLSGAGYVDSPLVSSYPTVKARTVKYEDVKMIEDAQEDDEENGITVCSTQEELDAALRKKCEAEYSAGLDKPKVTISVDMVLLENTREYAEYKDLERVSLGDTVHLKHHKLGIQSDARVISLEYDCVRKKVYSVVIGDFEENYFSNVSSVVNRVEGAIRPDGSLVAERVSGFISGAMAGLRAQYDVAEKQDVLAILFENLDESSELYGALGIGTQGVMISKERTPDGRSWKWTTALTANGLIADVVVAGLLSDKLGKNFWNLDTGEFSLSASATVDGSTVGDIADSAANSAVSSFDESLTQQEVFDRLTDDGRARGMFLTGGQLYVSASYINTGTFKVSKNGRETFYANADTGDVRIVADSFYLSSGDTLESTLNDANAHADQAAKDAQAAAEKKAADELNSFIDATYDPKMAEIQKALDGQMETYYLEGTPAASNTPAKDWTTAELKKAHEGDLYYDKKTGYAYRWTLDGASFSWVRVKDADITSAMSKASAAQDTADGKRRTFLSQPKPPYDRGDLWYGGTSSDVKVCTTAKAPGASYSSSDWQKYDKYIDQAAANSAAKSAVDAQTQEQVFNKLTGGGTVNGLFMEDGQLYVNASYIKTGTLVLGGKGNARGKLRILDTSDAEIGRWDNGGIYINGGSIYCKSGDSELDIYGGHEHIVYKGTDLGFMGGNGWANLEDVRGINFDMNKGGAYMTWAARTADTGNYIVKLLYANRSFENYAAGNLYIECPLDARNYAVKNAVLTDCTAKNSFSVPNNTAFDVYADADWHNWRIMNASLGGCCVRSGQSLTFYNNSVFDVYTNADWHNFKISNVKFENISGVGGYRPFTGTLTVVSRIENNSNGGITWYTANHTVQDGLLLN